MMHRLGIEAQPDATRAAKRFDFFQQWLRDDAFAVVADDHRVGVRHIRLRTPRSSRLVRRAIQPIAGFAIHAHDLLFMRDDAGFDAGRRGWRCGSKPSQPMCCSVSKSLELLARQ